MVFSTWFSLSILFSQGEKGVWLSLVTPFILSQGDKGGAFKIFHGFPLSSFRRVRRGAVLTYVSTWLSLCHSIHLLARWKRGGAFYICLYMALPLSLHSSSRKVKRGGAFYICLYMAFPLSLYSSSGKVKKGGGFNISLYMAYISTWLCLCHSIHLLAR